MRDQLAAAEARAERVEAERADEHRRAEDLRDQLGLVRAALDQAQGEARKARQDAEAQRQAEARPEGEGRPCAAQSGAAGE